MIKIDPAVKEGQVIYVAMEDLFVKTQPYLIPYKVTKVESDKFYAYNLEVGLRTTERCFNMSTLSHNTGIGYVYQAYLTEKEFWDKVNAEKEKETLKIKIENAIASLSLEELRKINEIIEMT